jgi:hypothetical protein
MKGAAMKSLLALIVLVPAAWCQQTPALRARELFYTPSSDAAKPPAPPAPAKTAAPKAAAKVKASAPKAEEAHTVAAVVPLGLRYAMLKRDAAGNYVEVDPDTTFRSGDRIRIQVDANTSGYLYVVTQGSSGNWTLLFPSKEVAGGSNHVQKGDSRQIPPGDRGQFVFDEQSGAEKLFIVLARQPEPDLDKLIYAVGGSKNGGGATSDRSLMASASLHDDVVSRLRQVSSRDLVFEKVDSADANGHLENAAYVVNPSKAPDARLVADLVLKHK